MLGFLVIGSLPHSSTYSSKFRKNALQTRGSLTDATDTEQSEYIQNRYIRFTVRTISEAMDYCSSLLFNKPGTNTLFNIFKGILIVKNGTLFANTFNVVS